MTSEQLSTLRRLHPSEKYKIFSFHFFQFLKNTLFQNSYKFTKETLRSTNTEFSNTPIIFPLLTHLTISVTLN